MLNDLEISLLKNSLSNIQSLILKIDIILENDQSEENLSLFMKLSQNLTFVYFFYYTIKNQSENNSDVIRFDFIKCVEKKSQFNHYNFKIFEDFLNNNVLPNLINNLVFGTLDKKNKIQIKFQSKVLKHMKSMISPLLFPKHKLAYLTYEELKNYLNENSFSLSLMDLNQSIQKMDEINYKIKISNFFSIPENCKTYRKMIFSYLKLYFDKEKVESSFLQSLIKKQSPEAYNYIEDTPSVRNYLAKYLPLIEQEKSFYIDIIDDYVTCDKEQILIEQCETLQQLKINCSDKTIQIKYLSNITRDDIFNYSGEMIIFITGGGFLSDLEILSQYYLRKQVQKIMQRFRDSYTYSKIQSLSQSQISKWFK